jgi:hypothetical protein
MRSPSLVVLSLCVMLVACGGGKPAGATNSAASPASAEGPSADCKLLVPQVDAFEATESSFDLKQLRAHVEEVKQRSRDISALALKDEKVRAVGKDYATYLDDSAKLMTPVVPLAEKLVAAADKLKAADEESKKLLQGCENEKPTNPSPACKKKLDQSVKLIAAPSMDYGAAEVELKTHLDDKIQKAENDRLVGVEHALQERLHETCGRPIPQKKKDAGASGK